MANSTQTVYSTGQTPHDIESISLLTSSLQPPRNFSPPAVSDPSYVPFDRSKELVIGYSITLAIAILAVSRRVYARITRSGSVCSWWTCLLFEDYLVFSALAAFIVHVSLGLYGIKELQWGMSWQDWTVRSIEKSVRFMYISRFLSDLYMTCVRIGLLLCFRRVYVLTVTRRVVTFKIIILLSCLNMLLSFFLRLFSCASHAACEFDIYHIASHKCDTRPVEITLSTVDAFLNLCVVGVLIMVVWTLSNEETTRNPTLFLTQPFFPCRPMVGMGVLGSVPSIMRIYYSRNNMDFDNEVNSAICGQVEGCIFILMSCGPMIRTLLTDYIGRGKAVDFRSMVVWSKLPGSRKPSSDLTTFTTAEVNCGTINTFMAASLGTRLEKDTEGMNATIEKERQKARAIEGGRDSMYGTAAAEGLDDDFTIDRRIMIKNPKLDVEMLHTNEPDREVVLSSGVSSCSSNGDIAEQIVHGGLSPLPRPSSRSPCSPVSGFPYSP